MLTAGVARSITSPTSVTICRHLTAAVTQHELIETRRLTVYNRMTKFEWDPRKAKLNVSKHRVSFEGATTVFRDPLSVTAPDPDHSIRDNRFVTLGMSSAGRLLTIFYAEQGESIRIISARNATKQERKIYEEG